MRQEEHESLSLSSQQQLNFDTLSECEDRFPQSNLKLATALKTP